MAEDAAILPHFVVDIVHKNEGVDGGQGAGLPFFSLGKDLVRNLADHFCRQFNPIKILEMVMDIPCAHPPGIQGNDFFFDAGNITLVFGDQFLHCGPWGRPPGIPRTGF